MPQPDLREAAEEVLAAMGERPPEGQEPTTAEVEQWWVANDGRIIRALAALRAALASGASPETAGLREAIEFLRLRPYGHVGPDRIPWFTHCGISHAEGAQCVVCDWLARLTPVAGSAVVAAASDDEESGRD